MHDLYIYYQVGEADAAALQAAVIAMQTGLRQRHPVAPQLKRRPDSQDGKQTWMEVYCAVPAEFAAVLADAVQQAGLSAWIAGTRHTEVFTDIVPCA
jgi:hypothetical protein